MLEKKKPDLSPDTAMRATTPDLELRIATGPWEIGAYYRIRHQVFVEEQGIFQGTDRDDHDESSIPIIACCEGRIAGLCDVTRSLRGSGTGGGWQYTGITENTTSVPDLSARLYGPWSGIPKSGASWLMSRSRTSVSSEDWVGSG